MEIKNTNESREIDEYILHKEIEIKQKQIIFAFGALQIRIKQIIDRFANKKSPGHDLITNEILKNLTIKSFVYF